MKPMHERKMPECGLIRRSGWKSLVRHTLVRATLAWASLALPAQATEPLALMYYDRPPFMIDGGDGSASGLTVNISNEIMKTAKLDYTWHKFAAKRILELVRENAIHGCGIGWFKNPEREQFARFSKPIYHDKPQVAVAPKKFVLPADTKLFAALAINGTRILVKEGFSYGAIDPLLLKYKPVLISTAGEVVQMMQMIKANRADMTFLPEEEAMYLLGQAGFRADDFNLIKFPDMPPGSTRHLMCSKKVPESVMQQINAAIRFE
jgi:uncharacterized protein (TIGR02285 family)